MPSRLSGDLAVNIHESDGMGVVWELYCIFRIDHLALIFILPTTFGDTGFFHEISGQYSR